MSEIKKIRIRRNENIALENKISRPKPPDPYRAYMLLHGLLGFPLMALLGALVLDVMVWLQSGRYQGLVFWLLFAAALTFIIWLPVSLICSFLVGNIARKSGWKRNRAGMVASALLSAKIYSISLFLIFFLIYAMGDGAKFFRELGWVIFQTLLFGVFAGVVGGLFARALPREVPDNDET